MEIMLLGDEISAEEAHRIGFVNEIVEPAALLPRALEIADRLARNSPIALRKIKEAVIRTSGLPLEQAYAIERECAAAVMSSQDAREGPRAFMEKRPFEPDEAELVYLVGVTYDSGAKGHLLGVVDAVPEAEPAIARAVSEVLALSGLEAGLLDVGFFRSSDPAAARMALVGLRFDLPKAEEARPSTPGTDPAKPPKLR